MSTIKIGDKEVHVSGEIPAVGSKAPEFTLTDAKLNEIPLKNFLGRATVLNIFPSIDTSTCAQSVREFNRRASNLAKTTVLCISKDLPFAMKRFCATEGLDRVVTLSDFRSPEFAKAYPVEMTDGPMRGLFARVVIVIDEYGVIKHTELVPLLGDEPDYEAALKALV